MRRARLLLFNGIALALCACVLDSPWKHSSGWQPANRADGWKILSPQSVQVATESLDVIQNHLLDPHRFFNTRALLIAKNGHLIFESYSVDENDRERLFKLQSSTKSLTALAVGIALDSGWIAGTHESICDLLPGKCPADSSRQSITLQHLLNMQSGLDLSNDNFSLELYVDKPSDPLRSFLSRPFFAQPGLRFEYRDVDPHLIAAALQTRTGKPLDIILDQALFTPMGITEYFWDKSPGGWSTGAFGAAMKPRDILKIAQLALDSGEWNNESLISRTWMRTMLTPVTTHTWNFEAGYTYSNGYYWWHPDWIDAVSSWGHGGQFALAIPAQGLAVVMVSLPDSDGLVVGSSLADLIELLQPILAK